MSWYSDERRKNPELTAKVRKVVVARQEALVEASALLNQAAQILSTHSGFVGDDSYARQVNSVRVASFTLSQATQFMVERKTGNIADNPTYLGNLAAGPLGEQIENMGDDFPL